MYVVPKRIGDSRRDTSKRQIFDWFGGTNRVTGDIKPMAKIGFDGVPIHAALVWPLFEIALTPGSLKRLTQLADPAPDGPM